MLFSPIKYDEPVFRPPAEAKSVIVQATIGCSYNKCVFCEMYTSKNFKVKKLEEVESDIDILALSYHDVKKIFLADGNAFVLSANKLTPILTSINEKFGKIQRISTYALPKDILTKSESELKALRNLGLKLLYIGIETGDDELLKYINKGETFQSTLAGITKAQDAGIETSIMILNGLGGKKYSEQHAINSAIIINQLNPKFLSTLTLSFPYGEQHFINKFQGAYEQQTVVELFKELKMFISALEVRNVIYRSNHVSNNLILSGTLLKDQEKLITEIDKAINQTPLDLYPSTPMML
jgi:radical SAM superfamily enzyme YgiQ (UPF0313 family)